MPREELRARKVQKVLDWLEAIDEESEVQTVAIKQYRDVFIIAIRDVEEAINIDVLTETQICRWHDNAARRMISSAIAWSDAMAEEWPTTEKEDDQPAATESTAA
jgi:hypothetical protein